MARDGARLQVEIGSCYRSIECQRRANSKGAKRCRDSGPQQPSGVPFVVQPERVAGKRVFKGEGLILKYLGKAKNIF